jgi:hypothetical protein
MGRRYGRPSARIARLPDSDSDKDLPPFATDAGQSAYHPTSSSIGGGGGGGRPVSRPIGDVEVVQFEVLPLERAEAEAARLPEPVRLTVTSSPKHGADRTVDFAVRLAALGHKVTPHLAARAIRDESHLEALLSEIGRAGIDDVFVIGGDNRWPEGAH